MTLHVLKSLQNGILRMYPAVAYRVSFSVCVKVSPFDNSCHPELSTGHVNS